MILVDDSGWKEHAAKVAVLIPAWQPDERLAPLVSALAAAGFGAIVVVDDGSSPACAANFASAEALPRVHLLRHAVNLGKGRALKTGMRYFLNELAGFEGLVTADADGQHLAVDIERVARAMVEAEGRAVLGSRGLVKDVPLRSRVGHWLTRHSFNLLLGQRLKDTQTGLRGFPAAMLAELVSLDGERYEYEMTVLAHLCRTGRCPLELPVETVYIDGNRSSHFDPIRDSMRIYRVLARIALHKGAAR